MIPYFGILGSNNNKKMFLIKEVNHSISFYLEIRIFKTTMLKLSYDFTGLS
jgi:hypothetical protein